MTDRKEMLLEAERRGILPPDKQEALNEARRRGLIGESAQPVSAQDPTGAPPQSEEPSTANRLGTAFFSGANQGIANLAGAPVDLVNFGLKSVGFPASEKPLGGSESIKGGMESLGIGVGTNPDADRAERITGRIGQEVGAAATALLPPLAAARIGTPAAAANRAAATSLPQQLGRTIVDPLRQTPGAAVATDAALSAASGAGAASAREAFPGNAAAELAGQFSPFLLPAIAGSTVRGLARGGETGRVALGQAMDDFRLARTDPSVGQATGRAANQAIESTLGRLPGGISVMRRAGERAAQQVGRRVNSIADNLARDADGEQVGRLIQRGLTGEGDTFLGRFNDVSDTLYGRVDEFIPRQTPVSAQNTERAFTALASPIPGAENVSEALLINPRIARAAQAFAADVGEAGVIPYEALRSVRSSIGRMLSSPSLVDDAPRAELKRIYAAISDDLEVAAAQAGPQAQRAFQRANNYYRAGLDRVENVIQPLIGNKVPEKVFKALEASGKDGATTIRRVFRSLNSSERAATAGLVLRRMGHATPGQQGAEGVEFSINTFLTNWNRVAPATKAVLFRGGMRRDLDAIARVAERIRSGSQVLANPSGTGAAVTQTAAAAAAGGAVVSAAQGSNTLLVTFLSGMAATNSGARLMTSPRFLRWLATSAALPAREIPVHIARLANTLQDSEMAAEAIDVLNHGTRE